MQNRSTQLALAFGAMLLAGLLLTSGLRRRSFSEILRGITEGRPEEAPTTTGGTGSAPANRQAIVAFFMSKGLSRAAAAGIAGNTQEESSDNPGESGGGLFQDLGGRGDPTGTLLEQLEAAWRELTTTERGTLQQLQQASTPEEAARIFSERFERPGSPDLGNREAYAREAFDESPGGLGKAPTPAAAASHPKVSSEQETEAFRAWVRKQQAHA